MKLIIKDKEIKIKKITLRTIMNVMEKVNDDKIEKLNSKYKKGFIDKEYYFAKIEEFSNPTLSNITSYLKDINAIYIVLKDIIEVDNKDAFIDELSIEELLELVDKGLSLIPKLNEKVKEEEKATENGKK